MEEMVEPVEDLLVVENGLLVVPVSPYKQQWLVFFMLSILPTPPPYSVLCPRVFLPDGDLS